MTGKETPNIVREFTVGQTRIKIADNFCRDMSRENVTKDLHEIARTAQAYFRAVAVGTG